MFRNRNSQKPSDELYKDFKASYPGLKQEQEQQIDSASLTDALDIALDPRVYNDHANQHHLKHADPTPRGSNDHWSFSTNLTPSALDPDSHTFNTFADQMPGYYTPPSGNQHVLMHSQRAGDLHTPGFNMGLNTPLSLPTSDDAMHPGHSTAPIDTFQFQPVLHQHMQQHQFHSMNPFQMHAQQGFMPHDFHQHQSVPAQFTQMDHHLQDPNVPEMQMDLGDVQNESPEMLFNPDAFSHNVPSSEMQHPLMENFRYHVTLNAPTAMVKQSDEIPITYLNKGQAYTLNVRDTAPQHSMIGQLKYRTYVRISFEEDEQRKRPGACWQLWKEGRGTNEAHQRGGRLQAVEFVDPAQNGGQIEDPTRAKMDLEQYSFDSFCITWTPATSGGPIECPVPVRFNFLSTDFSHSKGVKGIPVRLCAKTEMLLDSMSPSPNTPAHEVCYCRVKLFRDHGAERKLSNDVAHVKKNIDKLNQQLAQIESGARDGGKRKRSSGGVDSQRPGKVQKHKRTWSMSSSHSSGGKTSAEDDLQMKLMNLREMFSSTRPSSILFLRGECQDDPDAFPVRLPEDSGKLEPIDTSVWDGQSVQSSTIVSPTPSTQSLLSGGRRDSHFHRFGPPSRDTSSEWKPQQHTGRDLQSSNPQHLASPPDGPTKVPLSSPTSGELSGWIEALGVDASYQPPPEKAIKPVACFYVLPRVAGKNPEDKFYRAVYLMKRTVKDFNNTLAMKCNIEPTQVIRTVRVKCGNIQILLDDDAIANIPEGQDMTAEFRPIDAPASPVKPTRQWDAGATDTQVDGELSSIHEKPSSGYELQLLY